MVLPLNILHALLLVPVDPSFKARLILLGALLLAWLIWRNEEKIEDWLENNPRCTWEPAQKPKFQLYKFKAALPMLNFIRTNPNG
jgi:hypothetical protein